MLKKSIRYLLNRIGYDISRIETEEPKSPFSVLRYVVREQLRTTSDFYFIQVGANDGVANDPIRPLVKNFHMKGLLVEPMPDFFERLKTNYLDEPQLVFENCAIGPVDDELSLYRFKPETKLPHKFFHGMARFDKGYMEARAKKMRLRDAIEEIKVPSLTFRTLLQKHNVSKIDLLQIDTEGFDFEIIKMAFAANMLPEIVNYEWTELSMRDRRDCKTLLIENGYSLIDVGPDVLCVLHP